MRTTRKSDPKTKPPARKHPAYDDPRRLTRSIRHQVDLLRRGDVEALLEGTSGAAGNRLADLLRQASEECAELLDFGLEDAGFGREPDTGKRRR